MIPLHPWRECFEPKGFKMHYARTNVIGFFVIDRLRELKDEGFKDFRHIIERNRVYGWVSIAFLAYRDPGSKLA